MREQEGPPGGPTILLLHGWTVSADLNWWSVYDDLRTVGRVIAVDHRGHGRGLRSTERFSLEDAADDAAGVLQALGVRSAIVVGYSMGGPISLLLWQRHPHLVDGLVLEATALEWRASRRERWLWKTMAFVEAFFRSRRSASMVDRWLRVSTKAQPELAPYAGWFRGELSRGNPRDIADAGRALGDYDARPFARSVDVPTTVVVTTKDRLVRPRKQRALAKATSAATIELDGDHDVCWIEPAAFGRATADAVRGVLDRSRPVRLVADASS